MEDKKTIKTRCKKCGYEWETKSKLIKVNCPSCGKAVRLREKIEHDE